MIERWIHVLRKSAILLTVAGAALALLFIRCAGAGGGGGDNPYLEAIKGSWSTGIKTNVTIKEETKDSALLTFVSGAFFEHVEVRDDGTGILEMTFGVRGTFQSVDVEYMTIAITQEFHKDTGQWEPKAEYEHSKYSVDGTNLIMIIDLSDDLIYDGTNVFDDNAVIPGNTDMKMIFELEPATVTVTGTIDFDVPSYDGPNDTLRVGMDTEDVEDADYITEVPITFGDTSKNYTINNVPPGIYYIGGAVDLPTVGEYDPEFDWLGTFGSVDILSDPPNAPVFSENTVFDFQLDQPWGGGD